MKSPEVHLDPNDEQPEIIQPEVVEEPRAVIRRAGDTLTALAEREDAQEIIKRAVEAVTTLRRASISMTHPDDWTLYRSPDGRITGYLESLAAWNLRPLWGVSTVKVGEHYKVEHADGVFAWCLEGDGYCARTDLDILGVVGVCYSNEDFLIHRKLHPVKLEIEMKRTARQRMEGIFVREGAGLKRVPAEELDDVWKGSTWKRSTLCPKGRGFGSGDERAGAASEKHGIDAADIPNCSACEKAGIKVKLVYRPGKGNRSAFFGCPNYGKHPDTKVIIPVEELQKEIAERNGRRTQQSREPGDE